MCILGPFAKQANSNDFPLRGFLSCVNLEFFAEQAPFLIEVSYFCAHPGAFRRVSQCKRFSSSKLPILRGSWGLSQSKRLPVLCASWAFHKATYLVCILGPSQSKQIQTPFLLEFSFLACILGPFAEQTVSKVVPLRSSYFVCILGPFP